MVGKSNDFADKCRKRLKPYPLYFFISCAFSSESKHLSVITECSISKRLRILGNLWGQCQERARTEYTSLSFPLTKLWLLSNPPHALPCSLPAPLVPLDKSHPSWKGQSHPPSPWKPSANAPSHTALSFFPIPPPHTHTLCHSVLALTDKLFCCLPLFCT